MRTAPWRSDATPKLAVIGWTRIERIASTAWASMAERMRSAVVHAHFPGAPKGLRITLSAGVACYRSGETIEELLARADAALYRAKRAGRDCVSPAEA